MLAGTFPLPPAKEHQHRVHKHEDELEHDAGADLGHRGDAFVLEAAAQLVLDRRGVRGLLCLSLAFLGQPVIKHFINNN